MVAERTIRILDNVYQQLRLTIPKRPAAFLVVPSSSAPLDIASGDLAFEKDVEPGPFDVPSAISRKAKTQGSRSTATRAPAWVERDGKRFLSFRQSALVQELPMEVH